jgi:hypothetical protein
MVCVHWIASVSSLWLPEEAKIETEQEEDEMDDGARFSPAGVGWLSNNRTAELTPAAWATRN